MIAPSFAAGNQLTDAIQSIRAGDWNKAEAALEQTPPDGLPTLYWKSYIRFRTGRYPDAISIISRYLEQKPESAGGHKILGLSLFMQGRPAEAESELKRATELDGSDAEALYYLGRLHFNRSDAPEALRIFEKVVLIDKTSVRGYNHLGQTLEALTRFDEAREAYRKAIEIESTQGTKSEWPYFNLGVLCLKEGRPAEAIELLREALTRNRNWPEAKTQLAVALFSTNQYEEARTQLAEVLASNPKNADAHYQMGRLLLKLGKPDQARTHFEEFESLKKRP
ncbi:MAG: tetratricopeptide repeat protein [Bryobacteraceae bacterium]